MFGPCSLSALKAGMDAIDATSDSPATKAHAVGRFGGKTVGCSISYGHQAEYFLIVARAQLHAGLDYRKAGDKRAALNALSTAASIAEQSIDNDTLDASVRADASDILKQANDALSLQLHASTTH